MSEGHAHGGGERAFIALNIAVLTVSDTRTLEDDKSGNILAERIEKAGHRLVERAIVADDIAAIRARMSAWIAREDVDVIISTGGTGLTGRDVTIEAARALFDKEIEGFQIAFFLVSWPKIGTSAMQSRATGGVAKGTYVFCLPGSPGAVKDGWDELLSRQLDARTRPCNFVEILPRLAEHLKGCGS